MGPKSRNTVSCSQEPLLAVLRASWKSPPSSRRRQIWPQSAVTIRQHFSEDVDIIVVDPLRNVFDGGDSDAGENDNAAMLFFLQQRLDALRDRINPDAGVILAHHTRKIEKKKLEEDPFQALSGASSLRGYYTTGLIMFQPDEQQSVRQIIFELRNGPKLAAKLVDKIDDAWRELEHHSERLVNQDYGQKLNAERRRKHDVILQISPNEIMQMEPMPMRLRATPDAITRLEQTFDWMQWIEVEERKLIWKRAAKVRWKTICWELGCDRSTAWRKWVIACEKIAARLNG